MFACRNLDKLGRYCPFLYLELPWYYKIGPARLRNVRSTILLGTGIADCGKSSFLLYIPKDIDGNDGKEMGVSFSLY